MTDGANSTTTSHRIDWSAAGVFVDPHPLLHRLRATAPVCFDPQLDAWVLTSYPAVKAALGHPRLGRVEQLKRFDRLPAADQEALRPLRTVFPTWGGQGQADAHARFTQLLGPRLAAARVQPRRPLVQATLDRLLGTVEDRQAFDLANQVARPFAMQVMADLVGVPTTRMDLLLRCARKVPGLFELGTTQQLHQCQTAVLELSDYVRPVVADRRQHPQDDLVSAFLEAGLDEKFVAAQAVLLLVVGSYPPGNLLATGMQLLFDHPDQRARLAANPRLVSGTIDEMVRFSPPPPPFSTREVAEADLWLGGQLIRKGQSVVVVLGAANRDPAVFPDPDRFDVAREDLHRHLGFGTPPFACLGRALVRQVGEVFFTTILGRLPDLRPTAATPDWVPFRPFGRELRTLLVARQ